MDGQSIYGYDFRFNEKILKGPEVLGKYSADLFVNRAKAVFEEHRALEEAGQGSHHTEENLLTIQDLRNIFVEEEDGPEVPPPAAVAD